LLGPEGAPLKRDYYSPETGEELETDETIRGFETAAGKHVTVSDEDLERLAPEKSRDIKLRLFVPRQDISPLYFTRGYVLTPQDKPGKAYHLLAKTMEESDRAGVATFVMRGREYLVVILASDGILRAEALRFSDEIRTPSKVGLPKKKERSSPAAMTRTFETAIARLSRRALDRKEMRDEYAERMMKLIEKKRAKHKDVVESEAAPQRPTKVVDLMEVLKKSLNQGKPSSKRRSRKAA
jgi:DNA end-binding protein Ku